MADKNTTDCKKKGAPKGKRRLRSFEKRFVFIMLAQGHSSQMVANAVKDEYGYDISSAAVRQYRTREEHRIEIDRIKAEIEDTLAYIPIAQKSHRLAVANHIKNMGLTGYKTQRVSKDGSSVLNLTIRDPYLAIQGLKIAQNELGTDKDFKRDKAIRDSGFTINHIEQHVEDLPADERERLKREIDACFPGNGSAGRSKSRLKLP